MSEQDDDGGPAFPFSPCAGDGSTWIVGQSGMSLRDYFAAKAMAAFMAAPVFGSQALENPSKCAEWAYEQADAMLAKRGRPAGPPEAK